MTGFKDYRKYRWFFTSNGKLVIGGKNAEQNELLVKHFMKKKEDYTVMHTSSPGSPFSFIISEKPTKKDLEETAIFTGCFSRAWRENKKKIIIDIFKSKQIVKVPKMKIGTFGVLGKKETIKVKPKLYLTKQKGVLRAVPYKIVKATSIIPGRITKDKIANEIAVKLEISVQEVIEALPTGKSSFAKSKISKKSKDKTASKGVAGDDIFVGVLK